MTQDKGYGLLFQTYAFSSPELKKHEDVLLHTINRGYDVPRFQYNVITTPRIKHSVIEDLCVVPEESSYTVLCFADARGSIAASPTTTIAVDEQVDDAAAAKAKLLELYPRGTIDTSSSRVLYDESVPLKRGTTQKLALPTPESAFTGTFLGMACIKPYGNTGTSYELTGFVSFYPGIGTQLMRTIEQFALEQLAATDIWITAIEEHHLGGMYGRFGYSFVERIHVPVTSADGGVAAGGHGHLENDIAASRDFHLEVMCKTLT